MSWIPSDEWYEDLFDECKTKADVVERAIDMIRNRDKTIYENDEKFQTIAQGHVATIESLINQMY